MAKRKKKQQAKGYKPPSLSEIFEPLVDGWQNIGDSLVFDPNSLDDFGEYMTIKDAKKFREEYGDPTDVQGSGRKGNISKKYEITPSKSKIEESQNDLTTQAVNREEEEIPGEGDESTTAEPPSDSDKVSQALLQEKMDGIQQALKDYLTEKGASHGRKVLDKVGNKAYTTNFQEAMRHANKTQAWEDTINTDAPLEKSNVFSKASMDWGMYKEGDILGVMTRNQRRAYDEDNARRKQQAMADEATGGSGVYGEKDTEGQGTLTEWTTDQEVNEGGVKIETPQSAKKDMSKHSNPETSYKPAKDNEDD